MDNNFNLKKEAQKDLKSCLIALRKIRRSASGITLIKAIELTVKLADVDSMEQVEEEQIRVVRSQPAPNVSQFSSAPIREAL